MGHAAAANEICVQRLDGVMLVVSSPLDNGIWFLEAIAPIARVARWIGSKTTKCEKVLWHPVYRMYHNQLLAFMIPIQDHDI